MIDKYGVSIFSLVNSQVAYVMTPIPNIANGLIPIVSSNLPAIGPKAPITNAPGSINRPESNAEKPRRFCK